MSEVAQSFELYSEKREKTVVDVTKVRPTHLMSLGDDLDGDLYEAVSLKSVLDEFTVDQLDRLYSEKGVHVHVPRKLGSKPERKEFLVNHLSDVILEVGIKSFTSCLTKELMIEITGRMDYEHLTKNFKPKDDDKKKIPKNVYQKRFAEWLLQRGFYQYMRKVEPTDLKMMITLFGYTPVETDKRSPLAKQLTEILHIQALRNYFDSLSTELLNDVMSHMDLWSTSPSKQKKIDCIIFGTCYTPEERPPQEVTEYTKKPRSISKKLKKVDLQYWYLASELREFCKDHGLVTSGKKNVLAQRIVDYFDPEKENEVPGKKGRKARKTKVAEEEKDDQSFSGSGEAKGKLKERSTRSTKSVQPEKIPEKVPQKTTKKSKGKPVKKSKEDLKQEAATEKNKKKFSGRSSSQVPVFPTTSSSESDDIDDDSTAAIEKKMSNLAIESPMDTEESSSSSSKF